MPKGEIIKNRIRIILLDVALKNVNPDLVTDITLRLRNEIPEITSQRLNKILHNSAQPDVEETRYIISILNEYLKDDDKLTMDDLFETSNKAA